MFIKIIYKDMVYSVKEMLELINIADPDAVIEVSTIKIGSVACGQHNHLLEVKNITGKTDIWIDGVDYSQVLNVRTVDSAEVISIKKRHVDRDFLKQN